MKRLIKNDPNSLFNMKAMMIHVVSFSIFGLTIFSLMVVVTTDAFISPDGVGVQSVFYASIVFFFVSNIILLHIFNNLVSNDLEMATYQKASSGVLGDGSVLEEDTDLYIETVFPKTEEQHGFITISKST